MTEFEQQMISMMKELKTEMSDMKTEMSDMKNKISVMDNKISDLQEQVAIIKKDGEVTRSAANYCLKRLEEITASLKANNIMV